MLEVITSFTPFKMKISRREPISLSVEITNAGKELELVSLELMLGNFFSLEKPGFKNSASEKIPEFKPGQRKKFYYDIWPKQMLHTGEHTIRLTATEHYNSFNYVKRKYDKPLKIAVEE